MRWFSKHLWLIADDPDSSWYCRCRPGVVDATWHNRETAPAGGTGWLWTCTKCSRAFMFAKAVRLRGTLEELARKRTPRKQVIIKSDGRLEENCLLAMPSDWLKLVSPIASSLTEGERYVFFDGQALPVKQGPIKFQGLFRSHDLPDLPHLSESLMVETIANPAYWCP